MSTRTYKKLISISAPAITALGLHHFFDKRYSGRGHILMFHRVLPGQNRPRVHNHESLEITPEQLEQTIQFFQKRNYTFLSIENLPQYLKSNTKRKFVIFTFDDGYADNLEFAYPIFKEYKIPFTIYLTTNFINARAVLWWYHLEEMLLERQHIHFHWDGREYQMACHSQHTKETAFGELRKLITGHLNPEICNAFLENLFDKNIDKLRTFTRKEMLTWDEISELAKDPIVTFGAHTANHLPLRNLSSAELHSEIIRSREEIESRIGKRVLDFAYPFGKTAEAAEREYKYIRSQNFRTAVTTNIGNVFSAHSNFLHQLPRVNINSMTNHDVLALQVSGMVSFFKNGKEAIPA